MTMRAAPQLNLCELIQMNNSNDISCGVVEISEWIFRTWIHTRDETRQDEARRWSLFWIILMYCSLLQCRPLNTSRKSWIVLSHVLLIICISYSYLKWELLSGSLNKNDQSRCIVNEGAVVRLKDLTALKCKWVYRDKVYANKID